MGIYSWLLLREYLSLAACHLKEDRTTRPRERWLAEPPAQSSAVWPGITVPVPPWALL
jgi:hypothetical protein